MANANAERDGYGTFDNKDREQARVQANAAHARAHAAQCDREAEQKELTRKRAEEDQEYDKNVQTWQEQQARQKVRFARKAPKPISVRLTCTLCGKPVMVSSQDSEAWECHVRCGRRRANGV